MLNLSLARQMSLHRNGVDRSVSAHQASLRQAQEKLASGRKINRASDDPAGFALARRMETLSERYTQFQRNADSARFWLDSTQDSLDSLADRFTNAYEDALQANTSTLNADDREIIAKGLEEMLEEIVGELNTKVGDEYLFAGSRTTVQPFALDNSATADGAGVTYYGNGGTRAHEIGDGILLDANISGSDVLDVDGTTTLTERMQNLIDAIRTGDPAQIGTATEAVVEARDHLLDLGSEAGARARRLTVAEEQLQTQSIQVERRRSEAEDADMAATFTELQGAQSSLQASLKALATVSQISILDYLR